MMNWSLRRLLFVCFCLLVLAFGGLAAYVGARIIRDRVFAEAQARVESNLHTGRALYDTETDKILSAVRYCGAMNRAAAALQGGPTRPAQAGLAEVRSQAGLDFLTLVDADGRVLVRATSPFHTGDSKGEDRMVVAAIAGREISGTRILTRQELELESPRLAQQAYTVIEPTPRAKPRKDKTETSGLVVAAAAPVRDRGQTVIGAVYGGRLLNRNYEFVDSLRDAAFGAETYDGKHVGTVTIFQWDLRIATNVVNAKGDRAIGTLVSSTVYDRVLGSGRPWFDRAFVVNDWYLSAYEPIRDLAGHIVGIFYMGILERKYEAIRAEAIRKLLGVTLAGMVVAIAVAYVLALKLTTPLGQLAEASRGLAASGPGQTVEIARSCREVEALAAAFNDMSRQLQARQQELVDANEALHVANRNYMEMLGFVTHELKSPLASCTLNVGILKNEITGPLNEAQKKVVDSVGRNLNYFNDMIKNYLDLSRIEKGELELARKEIKLLDDVVRPILDAMQSQFEERQMTVEVEIPKELALEADPNLLRIAYDNFLSNAAKYGRDGGKVRLGCQQAGSTVRLNVWNEGEGVPRDQMPKLFQKFSRVVGKGSREKGTGLGLFISREIVEKHGGHVWAESEPGQWADFIFEMPVAAPAQAG